MSSWITVRPARSLRQTTPMWSNNSFSDPFFNEALNMFFGPARTGASRPDSFGLNVGQQGDNYYLWAVLPGVSAEQLEINVQDDKLTISASVPAQTFEPQAQPTETEGEGEKTEQPKFQWLRRELPTNGTRYYRELTFPTAINAEGVQASYENGILRVIVPQAPQARAHRVAVNTSARPELNQAQ